MTTKMQLKHRWHNNNNNKLNWKNKRWTLVCHCWHFFLFLSLIVPWLITFVLCSLFLSSSGWLLGWFWCFCLIWWFRHDVMIFFPFFLSWWVWFFSGPELPSNFKHCRQVLNCKMKTTLKWKHGILPVSHTHQKSFLHCMQKPKQKIPKKVNAWQDWT